MPRGVVMVILAAITGCSTPPTPLQPADADVGQPPLLPGPTFLSIRIEACPTAAEIAAVSDVRLFWDQTATSAPFICRAADGSADLSYIQRKAIHALVIMKELRFDTPLPWTPKPLYDWFRDLAGAGRSATHRLGSDSRHDRSLRP